MRDWEDWERALCLQSGVFAFGKISPSPILGELVPQNPSETGKPNWITPTFAPQSVSGVAGRTRSWWVCDLNHASEANSIAVVSGGIRPIASRFFPTVELGLACRFEEDGELAAAEIRE